MLKVITTIGAIQILAIGVNFIRSKTIAVLLGPEGVGVISVVDQMVMMIAQLSAFSLPFAAVKFLSLAHSKGYPEFRQSYGNLLRLLVLLTSVGAAIGVIVVLWHPEILGEDLANYRLVLVLGLISIPLIALQGFLKNVLAAAREIKASAFMDVAIAIVITSCVCVGIVCKGVIGFYWGNLIAGALIVMAVLVYLNHKLHLPLFQGQYNVLQELKKNPDIITFSLIMYTAAFLYPLSLFIARYSIFKEYGHAEAGFLQAALALSSVLNLVLNPANGLYLTPIINRDISKQEKLDAAIEFQEKLMIAIGVLAIPMVLFSQWMVILLFSSEFLEVSQVLFIFVITQCVIQLAGIYQALMIGLNDLKIYSLIMVFSYFSFAVLAWLFAPRYGLAGVAVSQLISSLFIFGLTLAHLTFRHGLTLSNKLICFIIYEGFILLCFSGLTIQLDTWAWWGIATKFLICGLFFASLLVFLSPDERYKLLKRGELLLPHRKSRF
jgi:O-antigen/teichoic acid export membrane protein